MKIGLFFESFSGGGAEKIMITLAEGFQRKGHEVFIYVINEEGPLKKTVAKDIGIFNLEGNRGAKHTLLKIRKIIKAANLDVILSTQEHVNAAVGISSIGIKRKPKIIFREANTPSKRNHSLLRKYIYKYIYTKANKIISVSNGVKEDLLQYYGLSNNKVITIYNPVIDSEIFLLKEEKVHDVWFKDIENKPIILGIGRVHPQKGFDDLIKAFKMVRKNIDARLIIYGEKNEHSDYYKYLKRLISILELDNYIKFGGFVDNPFKYLSKSSVFVLSSKNEGLPSVIIQALACGCPVVSTDCKSGPREILENGKYGFLVDVGDYKDLSRKIIETITTPSINKEILQKRAMFFSRNEAITRYLGIL